MKLEPWVLSDIEPQYNEAVDCWQVAIIQKNVGSPESGRIITAFAFGETREQCIVTAQLIAQLPETINELIRLREEIKDLRWERKNADINYDFHEGRGEDNEIL